MGKRQFSNVYMGAFTTASADKCGVRAARARMCCVRVVLRCVTVSCLFLFKLLLLLCYIISVLLLVDELIDLITVT